MPFLTAEWRKLAIANYEVDSWRLDNYLPAGTEHDLWNGVCYVSLVGFMFCHTRLLGMKIPFHVHFEEVNLRFYVRFPDRDHEKRGVVFIREIVPRPALALVANTLYKEHYRAMPMRHEWEQKPGSISVAYRWKSAGYWQQLEVEAGPTLSPLQPDSEAAFITEHYWGYSRLNDTKTVEYQVTHPPWEIYPVISHAIDVDFGACYGAEWSFLQGQSPKSVMLAEGSPITVEHRRIINLSEKPG